MRMGERQSSSTSSTQLIKPNYHMVALGLFYQDSWYSVAGIECKMNGMTF